MVKENMFYMDLREARLGQTLGACCDLDYIARCTREIYRIRTKRKHNMHLIEHTVKKSDPNILYHTTFMYDIMVNVSKIHKFFKKIFQSLDDFQPIFDQILHMANIPNSTPELKGPMTPRMRKAMQKYQKPKFEDMPMTSEDLLWGSITDETCMNR